MGGNDDVHAQSQRAPRLHDLEPTDAGQHQETLSLAQKSIGGGGMTDGSNMIDGAHLRAFVERIETVERTIREEQEARKEIYTEAKSMGFDPKIIRKIISLRKQDKSKRQEEEALLDLYLAALGDLAETPLGRSAVAREFGPRA